MAYIGPEPAESFTSFATQTFSVSATTSYTLDHAVTNENEIALFINNVRQQPGSGKAYTASGTALTLSAATASTDTMYCVFLGRALQTVTPATNSITNAMITDSTITSAKLTGVTQGITQADQFRLTADITGTSADITSNLERIDTDSPGLIGSGMSQSSGIFTFPATGIYLIMAHCRISVESGGDTSVDVLLKVTTDNSSYTQANVMQQGDGGGYIGGAALMTLFDVENTTTHKCKFATDSVDSGTTIQGNTNDSRTSFTFIRLGDT